MTTKIIPQQFRDLRAKHNLTQGDMAGLCGVSDSTYIAWEYDKSRGRPSWQAYWLAKIRLEGLSALVELAAVHPFSPKGDGRRNPVPGDGKGRPQKTEENQMNIQKLTKRQREKLLREEAQDFEQIQRIKVEQEKRQEAELDNNHTGVFVEIKASSRGGIFQDSYGENSIYREILK